MKKKYEPSERTMKEVLASSREAFFKKNGYYGTEEDAVRLTEEARQEIQKERSFRTMKFYDDTHELKYIEFCRKMKYFNEYHRSVAYLFALDKVCREHIEDIFDFAEDGIIREGLHKGWQTSTSRRTTHLSFNLGTPVVPTGRPTRTIKGMRTSCRLSSTHPTTSFATVMQSIILKPFA